MLKLILSFLFISLAACSTNKFIGHTSDKYDRLSCNLDEIPCRINFSNDSYISYTVEEVGPNTYKVKGNVDFYIQVVGGMYPKVSFYVLFMDENQVQFERRVKTGTRKATFEFEVETKTPISKTTIEKVLYHTWS